MPSPWVMTRCHRWRCRQRAPAALMLRGQLGGSTRHCPELSCGSGWLAPAFSTGWQCQTVGPMRTEAGRWFHEFFLLRMPCPFRPSRPGPNSGGAGSRSGSQMEEPTTRRPVPLHEISDFRTSCADTRVEGRIGCSPSQATPLNQFVGIGLL